MRIFVELQPFVTSGCRGDGAGVGFRGQGRTGIGRSPPELVAARAGGTGGLRVVPLAARPPVSALLPPLLSSPLIPRAHP